MSVESSRPRFWQAIRNPFENWFASWPLPKVNPDLLSLISVVLAYMFVVAIANGFIMLAWLYLATHLLLDGMDGAVARRYKIRKTAAQKKHGQFVDLVADRASELILFVWPPFFTPWFLLALVNVVLTVLELRWQRALALPLRQAFFVVFTITALWSWLMH